MYTPYDLFNIENILLHAHLIWSYLSIYAPYDLFYMEASVYDTILTIMLGMSFMWNCKDDKN